MPNTKPQSECNRHQDKHLRSLKLRDTEEHLHSGAEVAAVTQVSDACVP